jgi:hypothetical protein
LDTDDAEGVIGARPIDDVLIDAYAEPDGVVSVVDQQVRQIHFRRSKRRALSIHTVALESNVIIIIIESVGNALDI